MSTVAPMSSTSGVPIDSLIAAQNATTTSGTNTTSTGTTQLGETDFLTLLTTELQNQDPTNPVDETQSIAQLAQFSALQATNNLSTSFANFQSNFGVLQSASLIGHSVSVNSPNAAGNSSTITGTISAISVVNGAPEFTMTDSNGNVITGANGQPAMFSTSQITGINN